jgi:hypothetical protein
LRVRAVKSVESLVALHVLGPAFVRSLPELAARFARAVAVDEAPVAEVKGQAPPSTDPFLQLSRRSALVRAALPPRSRW